MQCELDVPALKQLSASDWNLLTDYVNLMKPLACGLDRLQGELNASLGYVMPTLFNVNKKITCAAVMTIAGEKMRSSLLTGIKKRFGPLLTFSFENKELILASVSHPFFKLNWIENEEDKMIARELFTSAIFTSSKDESFNNHCDESDSNNYDDFFETFNQNSQTGSRRNSVDELSVKILNYLNDTRKELKILNQHVEIKSVFIKYNTTLSSSAPVERLFSQALIIFTPRRNRLSSGNFERALILKHNKELSTVEIRNKLN